MTEDFSWGHFKTRLMALGASALIIITSTQAWAGLPEIFEEGNEAFWSGNYEEAVRSYERLIEHGVWDADVFYNLGTAHARIGHYGLAILNLERAILIDPAHTDARENLTTVRRAIARRRTSAGQDADLDPPRSFWMSFLSRVTPGQVVIPFIICWVGVFLILGFRSATNREVARLALLIVGLLLGVGAVIGGVLLVSKASFDSEVREAIATAEGESILREGPGERFRRAFESREGDRLRVLDREGEWIHLRDSDGQEGWGQTSDFGELRQH